MQKRTQKTYDQYRVIELIRTKFVTTNSPEDKGEFIYTIYANDLLIVELQNWVISRNFKMLNEFIIMLKYRLQSSMKSLYILILKKYVVIV